MNHSVTDSQVEKAVNRSRFHSFFARGSLNFGSCEQFVITQDNNLLGHQSESASDVPDAKLNTSLKRVFPGSLFGFFWNDFNCGWRFFRNRWSCVRFLEKPT